MSFKPCFEACVEMVVHRPTRGSLLKSLGGGGGAESLLLCLVPRVSQLFSGTVPALIVQSTTTCLSLICPNEITMPSLPGEAQQPQCSTRVCVCVNERPPRI